MFHDSIGSSDGAKCPHGSDPRIRILLTHIWLLSVCVWLSANVAAAPPDPAVRERPIGDAWSDPDNPIVRLFEGERLDLWSLQKPQRPALPQSVRQDWAQNPVDSFILARLESNQLAPSPEAGRRTLIRRLYFDLIGLPPSVPESGALVGSPSPVFYERLVDRLLASPHYGVRWARHWLDVVRYADTNGFERDEFRPTQHQYRDYVVRAFNEDKPYDTFIREQLAGDEMRPAPHPPEDQAQADQLIATGYLRLGPYDTTRGIFGEDRKGHDQLMADLVNTTGEGFLGLTLSCCNCHDHKYDPISQADHFRMRAFFAAVQFRDDMVIDVASVQEAANQHNATCDSKIAALQEKMDSLLTPAKNQIANERRVKFPADILALLETEAGDRSEEVTKQLQPFVEQLAVSDQDALAILSEDDQKQHAAWSQQIGQTKNEKRELTTALGMTDAGRAAPATYIWEQGDYNRSLGEVSPGFLSVFDPNLAHIQKPADIDTTGRRTALADWIASKDNPLTARVFVNRLWQHHFDRPLVATPNDFGYSGALPTHPDLLDWLAQEFMHPRGGGTPWSVKRIQRMMVLSAAYRQGNGNRGVGARSPTQLQQALSVDPDNSLLWRRLPRRLEAETIRDSMLAVSESLQATDRGPPVWPQIPEAVKTANPKLLKGEATDGLAGWYTTTPAEQSYVRSLFTVQKRSVQLPMFDVFDQPDANRSCARRTDTTVAPQALMLLNSPFAVAMASRFAARVANEADNDLDSRVETAFRCALVRMPDAEELAVCKQLLQDHADRHREANVAAPAQAALADLCRALMNTNEFVYVD